MWIVLRDSSLKLFMGVADMQKIFYSELLKLRHLGTTKFLIIIPFLTVLIAFLMGGLQIFVPFSVYWWEAIFLYLVNGLLFIVDRRLEGQAGIFKMLQTGVSLGKFL